MFLGIKHRTVFSFSDPIRYVVQSHRLQPAQTDSQKVLEWQVDVAGAEYGSFYIDGAGDQVRNVTCEGPIEEIAINVSGRVEVSDTKGILKGHKETIPPLAYLRDTPLTKPDPTLRSMAKEASETSDELSRAHVLSAAVSDAITYQSGATQVATTAAQALAQGTGVCQDYAHSLICIARLSGLPARYVSGYLNSTEEVSSDEAGHAWAEIFINELGWVGFDASNRCCPDANYLRLGSGLDAVHAAPIRGITTGASQESMNVQVAVNAGQQ